MKDAGTKNVRREPEKKGLDTAGTDGTGEGKEKTNKQMKKTSVRVHKYESAMATAKDEKLGTLQAQPNIERDRPGIQRSPSEQTEVTGRHSGRKTKQNTKKN